MSSLKKMPWVPCTAGEFAMNSLCLLSSPNVLRGSVVGQTCICSKRHFSACMVLGPGIGGAPEKCCPPATVTCEYVVPKGLKLAIVDILWGVLEGWIAITGQAGASVTEAARVKGLREGVISPFPCSSCHHAKSSFQKNQHGRLLL